MQPVFPGGGKGVALPDCSAPGQSHMTSPSYTGTLAPSNLACSPMQWSLAEVKAWLDFCVEEFALSRVCVDKFNMNGKALCLLTREDFMERAPLAGDVLFNAFQQLKPHARRQDGAGGPASSVSPVKSTVLVRRPSQGSHASRTELPGVTESPKSVTSSNYVPILPQPTPQTVSSSNSSSNGSNSSSSSGSPASGSSSSLTSNSILNGSNSAGSSSTGGSGSNNNSSSSSHNNNSSSGFCPQRNESMPVYVAVPASMLSPAPTEKYSSDSDSCHNENVHSPITCDPELECEDVIDPNCELKYDPMQPQPDGECRLLWEFIYQLLEDSKYQHIVSWDRESEHELTFLIKNPTDLATFWGRQKNRNNMTYEKLSRALRYYYKMQIIRKVPGKRLTYEFLIHPSKIRKGQRGAKPHSQRLLSVSADSIPPPTPTTLSSSHISSSPLPSSPSSSSPSTQNLSFSQSAPRALPPQHATDIHSLTSNHRQHMLGCDDEMLYKNSNRDGEIHVFKHSPEIDPYMPVNRSSNSDFLNFPTRNSVWADDAAAAMAGTLVSTSTFHNHEPHLEAESQMFKQEPLSLRHSDGLSVRPMFDVPASRPSEEPKVSPHDNHFRYPPSEPYEVGAAVSRHLDCQMVDQRYLNQGSSSAAYSSQFSSSTRSVPSFPQLPQPSYMELSPSTSSVNSLKARSLTPPCNQGQLDCTKRYRPYPMHSPRYSVSPHGLMENNFCPPAHTHPPAHSSQLPQHFRHTQKHEEQREGARHSTPPNPDVLRYHIHQQLSPPTDKTQQASTLPVTTAKDRLPKFKMEPFVGEQDEPEDLSMKPSSTKDEGATERVALSSTLKGAGCKKDFPRSPEQASAVSPDSSQMDFKDGITNIKSSPKLMKAEYQDEVHSAFSSS